MKARHLRGLAKLQTEHVHLRWTLVFPYPTVLGIRAVRIVRSIEDSRTPHVTEIAPGSMSEVTCTQDCLLAPPCVHRAWTCLDPG